MSPCPERRAARRGRFRAFGLATLVAAAFAPRVGAAPLGTLDFLEGGHVTRVQLHLDAGVLRARTVGAAQDSWHVMPDGARPRTAPGAAPPSTSCGPALWAVVDRVDRNGDGRIDPDRNERVNVYIAATTLIEGAAGSFIAAIEVARDDARLLWSASRTELPALGLIGGPPALIRKSGGDVVSVITGSGWPRDASGPASGGELLALDPATGAMQASPFRADAALPGGIAVIDLDGDGSSDRLYFADAAGRVWRLHRADARGRDPRRFDVLRLAELGDALDPGTALLHAPDVALRVEGDRRWLDVSLGTSMRDDAPGGRHWLFRLRDPVESAPAGWRPISPDELRSGDELPAARRGTLHPLAAPLAARPITLAGRLLLATRAPGPRTDCSPGEVPDDPTPDVLTEILVLPPDEVAERAPAVVQVVAVDAAAGFAVSWDEDGALSGASCRFGDVELEHCPAGPQWRHEFWLREDAP